MSAVAIIARAAPVVTDAALLEPHAVRYFELYERAALRVRPGLDLRDIPVRVDHREDAPAIGFLTALRTDLCWGGGTWVWVHAEITAAPSWLRQGTGVSIGRAALDRRRPLGADWDLVHRALLTEVSLLSPGTAPAFPRASVTWIGEPATRAAAEPAEQVIYHPANTRARRYYDGTPAVR